MNDTFTKCLGCGRYRSDDGSWVEMRAEPKMLSVSHTYCETCLEAEEEKVVEWSKGLKGRVPA